MDVNVLQLNLGSFLIKNGEVDIEPPLNALWPPLLAIRGTDGNTPQKSQAIDGVAEVGIGGLLNQDFVGRNWCGGFPRTCMSQV